MPTVVVGEGGSIHKVPPGTDLPGISPPQYPDLATQAGNFIGAVGRAASAAIHGHQIAVPADVLESRRAICLPCEFNGQRENGGIRCTRCGCGGAKLHLSTERCPVGKWEMWSEPSK